MLDNPVPLTESEYEALLVVSVGGVMIFFDEEVRRLAALNLVSRQRGTTALTAAGRAALDRRWHEAQSRGRSRSSQASAA